MSSGLFATPTPTPIGIPQADGSGFIDTGWLHASVTPTPNDLVLSDGSGHISPNWLIRGNFSSPNIFQQTDGTGAVLGTGIALTLSNQAAALVWAGPVTGTAAAPTFRALATTDIPDLSSIYQPFVLAGTTLQYWRGDKTWQTLPTSLPPSGSAGGDLTGTYPNPTLAGVITAAGPVGSATVTPIVTYDAKGRLTAVSSATIAPLFSSITSTPTTLAGYGITDAQALNAKLTSISALANAVGWLHNDGSGGFTYSTPGGSGTVTSVGSGTGLTGGPITGSGTLAVTGSLATLFALANTVGWLHNNGAGVFAYTTPTKSDVGLGSVENTALSTWAGSVNLTTLGTIVTGVWSGTAIVDAKIASAATWNAKQAAITFGTGVLTALGVNIGSAGAPVLFNGALGTPTSGTLTNCTFPTLNQNTSGTAAGLSATLAVTSGGTGLATIASGKMLYASALNTFAALSTGNSLSITGGVLDTIQDIRAISAPTFSSLILKSGQSAFQCYNASNVLIGLIGVRDDIAGTTNITFYGNGGANWVYWNGNVSIGAGVSPTAKLHIGGDIKTADPSGGTAQPWKLGGYTAGVAVQAGKVRVEINGTPYDLLTA